MKTSYYSLAALERARLLHVPGSVAALDFLRGSPISSSPPTPWVFDLDSESAQPAHLLGGRIPLASEMLLNVWRSAGIDNIETFPVVLRLRGETSWTHHSVFNVIGLVDAADIDNLVLSPGRTRGLSCFRLFSDPSTLLVDNRVMRAMNSKRPAEGWGISAIEIEMKESM